MSWRRVPPVLRIAVVVNLAVFAVHALPLFRDHLSVSVQLAMAANAARFVALVLFAIGALDLSRQLAGAARRGAQIALVAALLDLALGLLWEAIRAHREWPAAAQSTIHYGLAAAAVGLEVGFAIAARRRFPRLAVAAIVVDVAARLLLLLAPVRAIGVTLAGLHAALVLALVLAASTEHDVSMPELAERGFRHAARGLLLRVIAVGLVPALALLTVGSSSTAAILKTATVAAALTSVVSLALVGIGAIGAARARLAELHTGPLYASGVGALVCAGVAVVQTSGFSGWMFDHDTADNLAGSWSIVWSLVGIASLGYLTRAIAGFAARRQLHDLRMRSSGSGAIACVLLLVSFAIMAWLISAASSMGGIAFLVLVSLVCGLSGTIMLARLCTAAADAVRDGFPSLPTATVT
jgi:hypothetical protein